MRHRVIDGARSGNSRYAEEAALSCSRKPVYLATAQALNEEMAQRIDQHRRNRGDGWHVVEKPLAMRARLADCGAPNTVILIERLTLWLSNCLRSDRREEEGATNGCRLQVRLSIPPGQSLMPLLLIALLALASTAVLAGIEVRDSLGRTVSLAEPARRIVALAPHIVENVYSAGAGNKLVGAVGYCDYPPEAQSIPRVGNHRNWSLEQIISRRPDVVLMWGSGGGLDKLQQFERLGLPVFVSDPKHLRDIPYTIRAIAALAGTEDAGNAEADRIATAFELLQERYQGGARVSVFYQVWNEPLQTLNGEHLISRVIELCGGRNAFAEAATLAPRISLEAVLARDPDAIVASGMDAARPEWLDNWKRYPSLSAVRNGQLHFIHPDHIQRPTARILLGAQTLCKQLAGEPP